MEPGVAYNEHIFDELKNGSMLVKDWNGDVLVGQGAAGDVAYPDFYNYACQSQWQSYLKSFWEEVEFNGIFLSDNEVQESCNGTCYWWQKSPDALQKKLTYIPTGRNLEVNTLSLDAVYADTWSISPSDRHNYYASQEARTTYDFFISDSYYNGTRRAFVVSRSAAIK